MGQQSQKRPRAESTTDEQVRERPGVVYRVKVVHSNAVEYCSAGVDLAVGDHVVVPTRYGKTLGVVLGVQGNVSDIATSEIVRIDRKARNEDLERCRRNRQKDEHAFAIGQEKIERHGLEMKLVSAHHLLGEPKVIFFFTAESRIDFRNLVRDLVSALKIRVELRQIGVRDESRVLGGMGVCGRAFCCHMLADRMNPVSIKMAKKQDLSLNSLKISGACGRLLCCLAYEYPYYNEEKSKVPSNGARLVLEDERFRVSEVNILSRRLRLTGESGRTVELTLDQVRYISSEKRWVLVEGAGSEGGEEEPQPES